MPARRSGAQRRPGREPRRHARSCPSGPACARPPLNEGRGVGVAGVHAPAFVERVGRAERHLRGLRRRVAGVHAPAFVERATSSRPPSPTAPPVSPGFTPRPSLSGRDAGDRKGAAMVSPGFTPRPSLSGTRAPPRLRAPESVAGVHAPAFVERTPRALDRANRRGGVSPGFTPRPSLSGATATARARRLVRVAGVHAPAFVERRRAVGVAHASGGVAGVHAPAFVERGRGR